MQCINGFALDRKETIPLLAIGSYPVNLIGNRRYAKCLCGSDEAAHLRLRTGALSIERQAAASAFARESNEVNLSRLRDIQEQDQRTLRPDQRDETEGAVIVHPFKRR